jgi:hypothetical protein
MDWILATMTDLSELHASYHFGAAPPWGGTKSCPSQTLGVSPMKKIVRSLWSNQDDQDIVKHAVANSGIMPQSMALSIERIAELRKQIAKIQSSIPRSPIRSVKL